MQRQSSNQKLDQEWPRWKWGLLATAFVASGVLLWLLTEAISFDLRHFWQSFSNNFYSIFIICSVSIVIQFLLSAIKWHMLNKELYNENVSTIKFYMLFFYTSISSLASQFLTPYLSSILIRSIVSHMHSGGSLFKGAAISIYDQIFDVLILISSGIIVLLLFIMGVNWKEIFIFTILLLTLIIPFVGIASRFLPKVFNIIINVSSRFDVYSVSDVLKNKIVQMTSPRLTVQLTFLSILRYGAIGLRSVGVALMLIPDIDALRASFAFSVVQISSIAAVTPGNIGVTEWGWVAIAPLIDSNRAAMANLALAVRIGGLASSLAIAALMVCCVAICYALRHRE